MFYFDGVNCLIREAAIKANALMRDAGFLGAMRNFNGGQYNMANCNNQKVVECMILVFDENDIEIKLYKTRWPWSKVVAKFEPSDPNSIYLNTRKIKTGVESLAGRIIHEFTHLVDHKFFQWDFGHGNNSSVGKEETAPYANGYLAKHYLIERGL